MTRIQKRQMKRVNPKYVLILGTIVVFLVSGLVVTEQLQDVVSAETKPGSESSRSSTPLLRLHETHFKKSTDRKDANEGVDKEENIEVSDNAHRETQLISGSYDFDGTELCRSPHGSCQVHFPLVQNSKDGTMIAKQNGFQNLNNMAYLVTRKGDKGIIAGGGFLDDEGGPPNQDRIVLYTRSDSNDKLIVLADGHGPMGHDASQQTITDLPRILMDKLASGGAHVNVTQAIYESFFETDQGDIKKVQDGGTTAIVMLRRGSTVYLASAGDSTAILASYEHGNSVIIGEARRHKPADPDERHRIESNGGTVLLPPPNQDQDLSSRVVVGVMALAMSRCLGDMDGKDLNLLTPEPTIREFNLEDGKEYFVLVSTDGVVDYLNVPKVVSIIGRYIIEEAAGVPKMAQALMDKAASQWSMKTRGMYRDDMSFAVARL